MRDDELMSAPRRPGWSDRTWSVFTRRWTQCITVQMRLAAILSPLNVWSEIRPWKVEDLHVVHGDVTVLEDTDKQQPAGCSEC